MGHPKKTVIFVFAVAFFFFVTFSLPYPRSKSSLLVSPVPQTVSADTNEKNQTDKFILPTPVAQVSYDKPVNILFLGLDGRKGDRNPRCDAIQMFSYNPVLNKLTITSIPRSLRIDIPKADPDSAVLGNSCHMMGIDYTVKKIEEITKIHTDYIVTAGFSQILGIIRGVNLPATPALQFLRNRNLPYGDYQRSHNQGLFIRDIIIHHLESIVWMPKTFKYLLFQSVNTNIPFETATILLDKLVRNQIHKNPERIILVTKLTDKLPLKEMHFPESNFSDYKTWQNDKEYRIYQEELEDYLENLNYRIKKLISSNKLSYAYKTIQVPFKQQVWLQLEDPDKRNLYHYELLNNFIQSSPEKITLSSLILDFITEMEITGQDEYKNRGEELLKTIGI